LKPASLDPELLRTFAAIVDTGSFTRAARVVHRTQSAVSMQMRRLEEHTGKRLLERRGRRLALTREGEALLGYARRILRLQEEAAAAMAGPAVTGRVRLGAPDDYVMHFLPAILARFAEVHPRVEIEVRCEEESEALVAALERGELDLALVTCDPGAERGEILRQEPSVWAASARHLVHEADPLPLALFQPGCWFRDAGLRVLDQAGRRYRVAFTSPSVTGVQAAVSAGLAVAVLGLSTLPPGVRVLRPEEGFPRLPAATIALERAPGLRSPAADTLAGHIAEAFRAGRPEAGMPT